jgi:hypothetical protein
MASTKVGVSNDCYDKLKLLLASGYPKPAACTEDDLSADPGPLVQMGAPEAQCAANGGVAKVSLATGETTCCSGALLCKTVY